jgi:tryptophan synthase alpha chain
MSSKIFEAFKICEKEKRPALLTYTVAGDNTKNKSLEIIKSIAQYADIIELGFPHNTPVADGGQIQESSYRALKKNIKLNDIFKIVKDFKKSKYCKPLILMGYFNLVLQYGQVAFLRICKKVGVDGLIIVDLPHPENKVFAEQCKKYSISFIQLVSPTTTKERIKKIIKDSHEMIYYISMLSTTGGKLKISSKKILNNYKKIKKISPKKKLVIGFGITTKNIASLKNADGLVVGSQLCKEITRSLKLRQNPVTNLNRIVYKLKKEII